MSDSKAWHILTLLLIQLSLYSDPDDAHAKLRRGIQSNNFTGQTNAVDVDKHM